MKCEKVVEFKCTVGHTTPRRCFQAQNLACKQCKLDDDRQQKNLETDLNIRNRQDKAKAKHAAEMAELDREIQMIRAEVSDAQLAKEQSNALKQKQQDLEAAKQLLHTPLVKQKDAGTIVAEAEAQIQPQVPPSSQRETSLSKNDKTTQPEAKSPSELEWERQKRAENASNDAIDALMKLTGLEKVKEKILAIKAKIETVARQGADMKRERLGMVMLGNPGTGEQGCE